MRGEYSTRQKRDMMAFLTSNAMKHYTLDELTNAMKDDGIAAGKTTIYRFMEGLSERGSVRKYSNDGESYYQYLEDDTRCGEHLHLMCRRCGALYHVDCEMVGELMRHIKAEHGFELDARRTMLVGICSECAEKKD